MQKNRWNEPILVGGEKMISAQDGWNSLDRATNQKQINAYDSLSLSLSLSLSNLLVQNMEISCYDNHNQSVL